MIDFSGASGRLKAIYDYLTTNLAADRMAKIDTINTNVDAATSSRAPAATALSSSVWTGPKAGYLDAAISGRLGSIKSVHIGAVQIAAGQSAGWATIGTTVDPAKCLLVGTGVAGGMNGWNTPQGGYLSNLTTTQVRAVTNGTINTAMDVGYCLVEFN